MTGTEVPVQLKQPRRLSERVHDRTRPRISIVIEGRFQSRRQEARTPSSLLSLYHRERLDRGVACQLLKPPIVKDKPTLPFTREEMARILEHAAESRLFILTMRYTGMRISDTTRLQASALNEKKVFLYTHK